MVKKAKKVNKIKKVNKVIKKNELNKKKQVVRKDNNNNNNKIIYIVSAFIILIAAGILVYHFYNIQKTILPANQSISQSAANALNASIHSSYNSPFPLYIQGFKKISAQLIPLSKIPQSYSVYSRNLLNISINNYINSNNAKMIIGQLIYSNSVTSNTIFKKITTIPKNLSSQIQNITILKNLPANYYGISSISNNKTIYSIIAQNNSKICSVDYLNLNTVSTSNTIINLLENTTKICFKV